MLLAALWLVLTHRAYGQGTPYMSTALDQYVALPDSNYRYEVWENSTIYAKGWTGYIIKMWSQQWLTPDDWYFRDQSGACNQPANNSGWDAVWWHWLTVIVPDDIDPQRTDHAFMYMTGGSNYDSNIPTDPYSEDNALGAVIAMDLGIIGVVVYQIPNQPLCFTDEVPPTGRSEDAMIAWTWKHFLENPADPDTLNQNSEWLARLPMTKGGVRAMDTVTDFLSEKQTISKFIVAGASKRGWTTWTVGLTDDRAVAIVPIVLDVLHMVPSLHHMWRAYGGWTFAFKDYYNINLTSQFDGPQFMQLAAIVDPFNYLVDPYRFQMPKLVINSANDEFLQGDNDFYWWDQMPAPKWRQICQNTEHSLATGIPEIIGNIAAWGNAFLDGELSTAPNFTWTIDPNDGHIDVYNDPTVNIPINVTMWHAHNYRKYGNRDWRILGGYPEQTLQADLWHPVTLTETAPGSNHWVATMDPPKDGEWEAFFVELFFPGPKPFYDPDRKTTYRMTTQISIVPKNKWPYPDCYGEGCYGELM